MLVDFLWTTLLAALCAGMTILYILPLRWIAPILDNRSACAKRFCDVNVKIVATALAILPLTVFLLSYFVTGSFSPRYVSGVTLLPGLALAMLLAKAPSGRAVAVVLIPVIVASLALQLRHPGKASIGPTLQLLQTRFAPLPIVIGDGQLYVELNAAVDDAQRSRLTFVGSPTDQLSADPSAENDVRRLASFSSRFNFEPFDEFVQEHPDFYLLHRVASTNDLLTAALIERGLIGVLVAENGGQQLFRAGRGRQFLDAPR